MMYTFSLYICIYLTFSQCGKIENQRLKSLPGQFQLFYDFFFLMCSLDIFDDKFGSVLIWQHFPLCRVAIKLSSHTQILILAHFYYCFLNFLCEQGHIAQNAHLFSYPTPILFFFVYKNLYKLSWRSSVSLCEKRYRHFHAVKVMFLPKFLRFRGYSLEKYNVNMQ